MNVSQWSDPDSQTFTLFSDETIIYRIGNLSYPEETMFGEEKTSEKIKNDQGKEYFRGKHDGCTSVISVKNVETNSWEWLFPTTQHKIIIRYRLKKRFLSKQYMLIFRFLEGYENCKLDGTHFRFHTADGKDFFIGGEVRDKAVFLFPRRVDGDIIPDRYVSCNFETEKM